MRSKAPLERISATSTQSGFLSLQPNYLTANLCGKYHYTSLNAFEATATTTSSARFNSLPPKWIHDACEITLLGKDQCQTVFSEVKWGIAFTTGDCYHCWVCPLSRRKLSSVAVLFRFLCISLSDLAITLSRPYLASFHSEFSSGNLVRNSGKSKVCNTFRFSGRGNVPNSATCRIQDLRPRAYI